MSAHALPAWLTGALPAARRGVVAMKDGAVRAGDVCRLSVVSTPPEASEGRLVLVLDVDPELAVASVMLAHTDYEIRTSLDVLVTQGELGLPFDLALETDLVGPVGVASLADATLGHVDEALLDDLRDAVDAGDIPASLLDRVGMPLRGQADARWGWKLAESAVLDRLLAAYPVPGFESASPVQVLAEALRATGTCASRRSDDLETVTACLLAYMARREMPPAHVLALLAQPPTAAALGIDMIRAIGPLLRVA